MDVHRLKFLDLKPRSITCLAFNNSRERPKLAVSRSDASIEIWRYSGDDRDFCHQFTIPGRDDLSIDVLLWCKDRLFSAGLSGIIHEWDILSLQPTQSADAMGSPIWCMDINCDGSTLAVGTDDGKVCLYDITNNSLFIWRTLDKQEPRIISLSWHPTSNHMAIGCADSTIRILDTTTGHCTQRITLEKFKSRDTLVWSVKYLTDFTVVSTSSEGKIQFWNGRFGTLKQSFHLHLADVLSLAIDEEESIVFASGIDGKVVCLRKINTEGSVETWVQAKEVRAHSHDVKSLTIAKNGLLASGGVDTEVIIYDTENFKVSNVTKYSPFSSWSDRFKFASTNTLLYQDNTSLKFWRITSKSEKRNQLTTSSSCSPDKDALRSLDSKGLLVSPCNSPSNLSLPSLASSLESDLLISSGLPVHFLEIKTSTPKHILTSNISQDGRIVAFSDVCQLWLYGIDTRILCVRQWSLSACSIAFRHDNTDMLVGLTDGGLQHLELPEVLSKEVVLEFQSIEKQKKKSSNIFMNIQYSPCGGYFVGINRKHRISIYSTTSYSCLTKIPRLDDTFPPCVTFDPVKLLLYVFTSCDRELYTYDINKGFLTSMGCVEDSKRFHGRRMLGMTMGIEFSNQSPNFLSVFDVDSLVLLKCGLSDKATDKDKSVRRKRKRNSTSLHHKVIQRYRELVFVCPMKCGELLVVEKPWTDVMNSLPPAIERNRYGT